VADELGVPLGEDHRNEVIDNGLNGFEWYAEVEPFSVSYMSRRLASRSTGASSVPVWER
jgi:hypothetical protein